MTGRQALVFRPYIGRRGRAIDQNQQVARHRIAFADAGAPPAPFAEP
jgi:hypothetical protein